MARSTRRTLAGVLGVALSSWVSDVRGAGGSSDRVLDGIPEVPSQLRGRMTPYLNTRSADVSGLSDDGRSMLITTRFAETSQVHVVRAPLGARTQLTFAEDPVQLATFAPGTDGAIVYSKDTGGNENYQFYRLDVANGRTTLLTDGKSRNLGYVWSFSGERIAFSSNARNGKDMDLYTSDAKSASAPELLLERVGHWVPMDWSRDGKALLVRQYVSVNESHLFIVDLATRNATRVTPEQPKAAYTNAVFAPAGKSIYVTSDLRGEFSELYELEIATGRFSSLTQHIPWNVELIALSPDGKTLALTTNEEGYSVLRLLDTRTRKEQGMKGVPPGVIYSLQFARKANVLAFGLSTATRTGDAYAFDLRRKSLVRWTESEIGGMSEGELVEPTLVHYETFDGKKIPAFFYRPKGEGPFPVIIDIHGGPESQSRPWFSAFTQYLVTQSRFAVLVPNVRGSNGYGKTFLTLDDGFRRHESVKDIGMLLEMIAKDPALDARRVAVYGGSYGGYMVLAALAEFGDKLRAGCEIVGISNFVSFLENTSEYRRDLRRVEYGDERDPKMRQYLTSISPATNVQRIKSALFVAQGSNDPRVPATESEQIVRAVRKQGQDVWYMLAKNEGHGFRRKENRDAFQLFAAMFFERHLGGNPVTSK